MEVISTISMAVCLFHGVASMLGMFLVCRPIAANWDPTVDGTCGNVLVSYVFMESVGLFLDVAILIVPPLFIFRLQIERRRMWRISVVFETGWL